MVPDACVWGMPRSVYEKIGSMDVQFKDGYGFDDNDYWMRANQAGIEFHFTGSNFDHLENQTFKTYFKQMKESMTEKNQALFIKKWKL